MEFEEMKKIWDSQNSEPLYAINERALHNRILAKKNQAHRITNFSELMLIIVNTIAGCLVVVMTLLNGNSSWVMIFLAVWMFASALYLLASRRRRIKGEQQFDRSMLGDLHYAISMATYQVRLSQLGQWNMIPIGVLTIIGTIQSGKPVWIAAVILVFFSIAYFASGWEHNLYKNRKRELEILQSKLES